MNTRRPSHVNTTVSSRYQTVIPSQIREKFMIKEGTQIAWLDKGDSIEVIPLPEKSWMSFRGAGREMNYLADLRDYRRKERAGDPPVAPESGEGGRR